MQGVHGALSHHKQAAAQLTEIQQVFGGMWMVGGLNEWYPTVTAAPPDPPASRDAFNAPPTISTAATNKYYYYCCYNCLDHCHHYHHYFASTP